MEIHHSESSPSDDRLGTVLAECLEAADRGEQVRQVYLARHPEFAAELNEFFAGQDHIERLAAPLRPLAAHGEADGSPAPGGTLGDFRIFRQVGRGGMGVVYEGEQISLGRRVALKVLPFAATMDPRHLQRFQNEARAAATLHHEHIVPVYAVGQERGVHYYAMQFIEGQTLADMTGVSPMRNQGIQETIPIALASTQTPSRDLAFFRRIAEWGIDAAEALEHAHHLGIVHRDIKPGNLMIDAQAKLWITDFGLARTGAEGSLTMTGDMVGTLRYMSPEQALAKHDLVDHRTDIYSLGVTLYELLTGQPAVSGTTREEILKQIVFAEPKRPRQLDRAIPHDLETIVVKAIAQEPAERYGTAHEVANDLRSWLDDRPIRARPPSLPQRAAKWSRRHRPLILTAVAALVLAVAGLATGAVLLGSAYQNEAHQRQRADEARDAEAEQRKRAEEGWAEADKQLANAQVAHNESQANLFAALDIVSDDTPLGEQGLRKSVDVLTKVIAQEPQRANYRQRLFRCLSNLSLTLENGGNVVGALEPLQRAVTVLDDCMLAFPGDREVQDVSRIHLFNTLARLADLLRRSGRLEDADAVYVRALDYPELPGRQDEQNKWYRFCSDVSLWNGLGTVRLEAGKLDPARQAFEKALHLLEPKLPDEFLRMPNWRVVVLQTRSHCRVGLGNVLFEQGKTDEASEQFTIARQDFESMLDPAVRVGGGGRQLYAWFLLTCPVPEVRNPQWAIDFARGELKDVQGKGASPEIRARKNEALAILGLAGYRMADWDICWEGGHFTDERIHGWCWLLEAAVNWHRGNQRAARDCYNKGVRWLAQNRPTDLDLCRLRFEAAKLLDIEDKPPR